MSYTTDIRGSETKLIPFRSAAAHSETSACTALERFDPEVFWLWAGASVDQIIEVIRRSADKLDIPEQTWKLGLFNDSDRATAKFVLAVCHSLDLDTGIAMSTAAACQLQHVSVLIRQHLGQKDRRARPGKPVSHRTDVNLMNRAADLSSALAHEIVTSLPCSAEQRIELVAAFNRSTVQTLTKEVTADFLTAEQLIPLYERLARDAAGLRLVLPVESALILAKLPKIQVRRAREAMRTFGLAMRILGEVDAMIDEDAQTTPDLQKCLRIWSAPVIWCLNRAEPKERERLRQFLAREVRSSEAEMQLWFEKIRTSAARWDCERHAALAWHNASEVLRWLPAGLQGCLQYGFEHMLRSFPTPRLHAGDN